MCIYIIYIYILTYNITHITLSTIYIYVLKKNKNKFYLLLKKDFTICKIYNAVYYKK